MIALNEIITNKELIEEKYKLRGKHYNLDKVVSLENSSRKLQQTTEKMRADCNKLCEQIATYYNAADYDKMADEMAKIHKLDIAITKNTKIYEKRLAKINKIISKFDNLPDYENISDLKIKTTNEKSKKSLDEFLSQFKNFSIENDKVVSFEKSKRDEILDSLPLITKCKDGYIFYCEQTKIDEMVDRLLEFFKIIADEIVLKSCKALERHSAATYIIKLDKIIYKLQIIREFNTRKYKIKYRDKSVDMTKFANQINIMCNVLRTCE